MSAGLSGAVPILLGANDRFVFGVPGQDADVVATIAGDPEKAAVFGYEAGATMVGMNAPARRVDRVSLGPCRQRVLGG